MTASTAGTHPRVSPVHESASSLAAPTWLDTHAVARMLGLTDRSLKRMRQRGDGPRFAKCGGRIRYRLDVVVSWMEANTFASTAAAVAGGAR
jgi:hypothetical protein